MQNKTKVSSDLFDIVIISRSKWGMSQSNLNKKKQFSPCSNKPNCVSSMADVADKVHFIAPLAINKKFSFIKEQLLNYFNQEPRTYYIKSNSENYLVIECKTPILRFVDDLELLHDPEIPSLVHVKSASRIGYSDMGINRKRVEKIRTYLNLFL